MSDMELSTGVIVLTAKKVRKGRPGVPGTLIGVRLQVLPLSRLDKWIVKQAEPGLGRPEAIRRLVEQALDAAEAAKPAPKPPRSRPAKRRGDEPAE
jgi:hypothetical protein